MPGFRPVTVTEAKQLRLHIRLPCLCAGSWQEATLKVKMAALAAFTEVTFIPDCMRAPTSDCPKGLKMIS